ncbi:carbohydrate ABC transporter permease [Pelagibius sp. CAU 1746]|uniref:carbohydrate ABC transporter permease n=1 Tax=Pelagibius sp. CAU 1746 TaxID=3140370 RepID=UPI00325C1B2C
MRPSWTHFPLALIGVIALAPSVFMVVTSLRSAGEYAARKVALPSDPSLGNYISALVEHPFLRWGLNSLLLTGGAVLLSTVVAVLAAYAIARMRFPGRNVLLGVSTSLMVVPPVTMIVPLFVLYTQLGLINTFGGTILIYAGLITPFGVFLLTTFFRTLPNELFEAATLDGAGSFRTLLSVVLPLSMPALLSLVVVNALYVWNDLLVAIIFLQDDDRRTLMAGISVFQGRYNNNVPLTMAGLTLASLPMLALYLAFQRYFIRGLMAGAVK